MTALEQLMKYLPDTYTRKARLQPALFVALPLGLAVAAWSPEGLKGLSALWGLVVWGGGAALISQVARDRGKSKESGLFRDWDGKPTTRLLRYRDAPNKTLLARRHAKLQNLLPDVQLPTASDEEGEPGKADEIYDTCVAFLIERTRDKNRFPLVFEELCSYGFRRNIWGMKPAGVALAVVGCVAVALLFLQPTVEAAQPVLVAAGLANLVILLGWVFWLTRGWVKVAAVAYAERLLAACDDL